MFLNKTNIIGFSDNLSYNGVVRQRLKYHILNILTRSNKVLLIDDVKLNKYNSTNFINADNIKQVGQDGSFVSDDLTIYEPHFDFIFIGNWNESVKFITDPDGNSRLNRTLGYTYFGFIDDTLHSSNSTQEVNKFCAINDTDMLYYQITNSFHDLTQKEFCNLLEQDIRDYTLHKLIK